MSSLYGTSQIISVEEAAQNPELISLLALDDILNESVEDIELFCESEEGKILMEKAGIDKQIVDKATVKKRDFARRKTLICYYLAKQHNDKNFTLLAKYSKLKKLYSEKIKTKYGKKAEAIARASQKEFIKNSRKKVKEEN